MKAFILIASLLLSSLSVFSSGNKTINMSELLEENLKFDNEDLNLEKNQYEFVKISFKVNEERTLEVLEINYSSGIIKDQLIAKLTSLQFNGAIDANKIYYYNFTFLKI